MLKIRSRVNNSDMSSLREESQNESLTSLRKKEEKTVPVDEVDFPLPEMHVTNWEIIALVVSIVSHVIDVGIDVYLSCRYYVAGQKLEFGLTLFFILFPALLNTVISIRMYVMDKDDMSVAKKATGLWVIRVLVLLFQLAPILRYCESLAYALRSRRAEKARDEHGRRRFYELMLKEDSDVALLRVFECFLEAAPQQVLQISILLANTSRRLGDLQVLTQAASILSSLFSMGWSMASYHRSIRFVQKDKDNISWPGTVMQFLWHFPITVSRILSISAIASVCPYWMAGAVIVHWLVMSAWISVLDRTQFCVSTRGDPWRQKVGETLFSFVLGLVYIFTYLTPGEGRTRNRFLVFYSLCFAENMAAVGTWAAFAGDETRSRWFFLPLICGAAVSYVLGVCFMLVYYRFFHPKRVSPPHTPAAVTRNS